MVQVKYRENIHIQELDFNDWVQIFRPKDATSLACGIPERYIHFKFLEKDWKNILNTNESCVWNAIQGEGSIHLVNGRQGEIAVAYMVTEIGWDADSAFHIDVPASGVYGGSTVEQEPVSCDNGCQIMQDNIIQAYYFEGDFSHWYCSWCGSTCSHE